MKSLSILVLVGTLTALVLGGLFAVSAVSAENSTSQTPASDQSATVAEPVAPLTGNVVEAELALASGVAEAPAAEFASADPGLALSNAFTLNLSKDTASAQAVQEAEAAAAESIASLDSFVASVSQGSANQVTGIYVDGVLAYAVSQQPKGNASYVTTTKDEVTQFGLAADYGSLGFLGHNYLSGASFSSLTVGQVITLVYGNGSTAEFQIVSLDRFQALSPDSTQSKFVNLDSGKQIDASTLFRQEYQNGTVVLQTCIANEGISTWGRLFVVAIPIAEMQTAAVTVQ